MAFIRLVDQVFDLALISVNNTILMSRQFLRLQLNIESYDHDSVR